MNPSKSPSVIIIYFFVDQFHYFYHQTIIIKLGAPNSLLILTHLYNILLSRIYLVFDILRK